MTSTTKSMLQIRINNLKLDIEKVARERDAMRDALLKIISLTDTSMDPALSAQNMVPIMAEAAKALSVVEDRRAVRWRKIGYDFDGTKLNIIEEICGQCRIGDHDMYCGCGKQPYVRTGE